MLADLEALLQAHQFTINALGAASTFAAVVVSLWLAYAAGKLQRPDLRASVEINLLVDTGSAGEPPAYVVAHVRNIGNVDAVLQQTFFFWAFPFQKAGWVTLPRDASGMDDLVPHRKYPVQMLPRTSESFFLFSLESFREMFLKHFSTAGFFMRIKFRLMSAQVITAEGRSFKAEIGSELRKEMRSLMTRKRAESAGARNKL